MPETTQRIDPTGLTHTGRIVYPKNGRNALGYYTNDAIWVPLCRTGDEGTWLWDPRTDGVATCLLCLLKEFE